MSEREDREPAGRGADVSEAREGELAKESPTLPQLYSEMAAEEAVDEAPGGPEGENDLGEAVVTGPGVALGEESKGSPLRRTSRDVGSADAKAVQPPASIRAPIVRNGPASTPLTRTANSCLAGESVTVTSFQVFHR